MSNNSDAQSGLAQHHFLNTKSGAGFTMIEVLVVMVIFILIAGFALFVSMDSFRGFSFRSERDTIVTVLQKARSQAMSNVCLGTGCSDGKKHGMVYDAGTNCADGKPCYIIFQGLNFASRDSAVDQDVPLNSNTNINMASAIIFNQLDGASPACSPSCDITMNGSVQIQVNAEGRIDTP